MNDLERPLPSEHELQLKKILRLEVTKELPDDIKQLYWDISRTARFLGYSVTHHELITIAVVANRLIQAPPPTFLEVVEAGSVKRDDLVQAKFRNQWRWGHFKGVDDEQIIVALLDDNAEVRRFKATGVRLATREELQEIGA